MFSLELLWIISNSNQLNLPDTVFGDIYLLELSCLELNLLFNILVHVFSEFFFFFCPNTINFSPQMLLLYSFSFNFFQNHLN